MNEKRRKKIRDILDKLSDLRGRVEAIQEEEQEALDNIPDSLRESERAQASEVAASALDDAVNAFDEIENGLNEAIN